ncbi:RHS repeat-associated core domain-containing protein, partial [Paucibacter sp. XJ19-41]|uniref:RHS repeat-associated core domain-containing protein n=1 Tax=Paucibacter sp. XJ19-41 TaxID=2927824 RepID=UPI0023493905
VWSAGGSAVTQGFDAWGQVLQASGSIPTYGYTGREPDASGLMFYRARYYHPGLGQFISRDPLGLAAGINPYAYADGNPVMFNDPEGLLPAKPGGSFSSYWGQINGTTRLGGLFGMVGGGAEMMAGGATFLLGLGASTTGVGAMVGVPAMAGGGLVATHGLDTFQAGTRQLMSGQATGTLTSQALQAMGASEGTAGLIDAGIGVVGSAGMGGLARGTERALMTGLTSDVVSKFAASPAMATGVLKQGQVRAVHNNPSLTAPMFGNAVEIQVANRLASNPILSSSFSHLSAPGRVAPDFASRLTGQTFDITTNTTRSFADHLARPYGSGLNIVPYDRPAGFSFP